MPTSVLEERFLCLEMLKVSWVDDSGRGASECAIVAEIWRSGAILQTETAIPKGAILTVAAPNGSVRAEVTDCSRDDYGFVIQMTVNSPECWFPHSYSPKDLIPKSAVDRARSACYKKAVAVAPKGRAKFARAWFQR